jgi:hypothetical protein
MIDGHPVRNMPTIVAVPTIPASTLHAWSAYTRCATFTSDSGGFEAV